jgi:hypothetical protein
MPREELGGGQPINALSELLYCRPADRVSQMAISRNGSHKKHGAITMLASTGTSYSCCWHSLSGLQSYRRARVGATTELQERAARWQMHPCQLLT